MIPRDARTHLRLIPSPSTEPEHPPLAMHPMFKNMVQSVFLPHSQVRLWLRMDATACGGIQLYYVKIVGTEALEEYKHYFSIGAYLAEEIVLTKHVKLRKYLCLFGISYVRQVFNSIAFMRTKLLLRDERLRTSDALKQYFELNFEI